MKIDKLSHVNERKLLHFTGNRVARNTVAQLAKNNPYSLTEPNQRRIIDSITALGKTGDLKTINFLLNTAAESKYSTNITLQTAPKNKWKALLFAAAAAAAALLPAIKQSPIFAKITSLQNDNTLNATEMEILKLRKQLLAVVNLEQVNNETKGTIRDFEKNLDYFIVSSETTLEHKKYVLERLNYFMSDDYEINPQLEDKKSIAVAEMINDMTISVPGNNIPNIKAVDQRQHGMCAAISAVRKKLVYEDKPNYVDSIISELDSSDTISVYDRRYLGSGKKINVYKVPVDFTKALAEGYRIIDASTMHWMQIGDMSGAVNKILKEYNPFDAENFDVKTDSFTNVNYNNPEIENAQNYYQALILAKQALEEYEAGNIKETIQNSISRSEEQKILKLLSDTTSQIKNILSNMAPELSVKQIQTLSAGILKLEKPLSKQIPEGDKYSYIPNEEDIVKKEKIAKYILSKTGIETISQEDKDNLLTLCNYYHSNIPKVSKKTKLGEAKSLYEIAAAYRYQVVKSLEDSQTLERIMAEENIPSNDNLLISHIDNLVEKLKNNSPNSNLIIQQMMSAFEEIEPTKENLIDALLGLKETITQGISETLDNIYFSLRLENRKNALLASINALISSIQDGNYKVSNSLSKKLNIKNSPEAVIETLNNFVFRIINGNEDDYKEIFAKLHHLSEINYAKTVLEMSTNNLEIDETTEEGQQIVQSINTLKTNLNNLENLISTCNEALRITDSNGDVLYSSDPKDVIIKRYENQQKIANSRTLRILQNHFTQITQDRSTDEFQTRRGKLKNKSLYNFSSEETALLKNTKSKIRPMLASVHKDLASLRRDLKNILDSQYQEIGVESGRYWVGEDIHSGLFSEQQKRILEYITGKPHREVKNLKQAIEEIKNSPFSGISNSSVSHTRLGMHAQYIADIAPVQIKKTNGEEESKEVLYQDNTWGAFENENTWVDSNGLKRTDYTSGRGGTLGYITDDNFRNGNFTDRILSEMITSVQPNNIDNKRYKRLKGNDDEEYNTPQYTDMMLEGNSEKAKSIADRIHDTLFIPTEKDLEKLQEKVENLSLNEIEAILTNIQHTQTHWQNTYETIKNRIFNPIIDNPIKTQEDYNNLANDDYLKVVLEKIAFKHQGFTKGMETLIAKAQTVEDIAKLRGARKNRALNSFKYAFSKSLKIVDFLADAFSEKEEMEVEKILKKYSVTLSDEDFTSLVEIFGLEISKYNGSAKNTINLIMENISNQIDTLITNQDANKELKEFFRNYLTQKTYLNESDIKNTNLSPIIKFIDREFKPADNEELIKIYHQIQDMTNDEFKTKILPLLKPEDLGLIDVTGYDILQKIKRYDPQLNTELMNTIYFDNVVKDNDNREFSQYYSYKKLNRTLKFKPKDTIESLYSDINDDLSILTLQKLFNKYKGEFLDKYGVYPAYPKVDLLSENYLKTSFDNTFEAIEYAIAAIKNIKTQIENYSLAKTLKDIKKHTKLNQNITGEEYNQLTTILGTLATANRQDTDLAALVNSAEGALELEEGSQFKQYVPYINQILDIIDDLEATSPEDRLLEIIKSKQDEIKLFKQSFSNVLFVPRHRTKANESLNEFIQAMVNNNYEKAETLKAAIFNEFKENHIINDPQELLSEYLKSCAKDSPLHQFNKIYTQIVNRAINYARLAEIQELLMEASKDGVDLNITTLFKNYPIELNDGTYPMNSPEIITYMTNMLLEEDHTTAHMFLEKLGVADIYVKGMLAQMDFDGLKKIIDEAYEVSVNYGAFKQELEDLINNTSVEISGLNKLEKAVKKLGKKYSVDKDVIRVLNNAIESIKYNINFNPAGNRELIFNTIINSAQTKADEVIQDYLEEKDAKINANAVILNFINEIMLHENSEENKARDELNTKFQELIDYKDSLVGLQEEE